MSDEKRDLAKAIFLAWAASGHDMITFPEELIATAISLATKMVDALDMCDGPR